ncbi:MAG: bifunctional 2-C-methyl-D-erythritol 4-phosphate cytidylyltransferase/2-C-methyl-D-erythritol 2,4-cyclodiphosphate synthase [Pseudomonadota bacterium]
MTIAALIVAAGRGTRAGGDLPKQWQPLLGRRVIDWTLAAFDAAEGIDRIVVVLHPDDMDRIKSSDMIQTVAGGTTRAQSVQHGLALLKDTGTSHVLIHDAARCCITADHIAEIVGALSDADAVAPALRVTDALWRCEDGHVTGTQDRAGLFRAQTPQAFKFDAILAAHGQADPAAADDVEVARAAGMTVRIIEGRETNLKITVPDDFVRAENILRGPMDVRTGTGFDVHRFGDGDHVMLCGVAVPHSRGLQGHSDADVGLHTLTDAIYGALAEGDIGRHFPPSDPQWKGAPSDVFLRHAVQLAAEKGYRIGNVDITLVCEHPKIGPHAAAMQTTLSRIMDLAADRISVKATTSERLGFTGREEGIAAQAVATLIKP